MTKLSPRNQKIGFHFKPLSVTPAGAFLLKWVMSLQAKIPRSRFISLFRCMVNSNIARLNKVPDTYYIWIVNFKTSFLGFMSHFRHVHIQKFSAMP